MKFDEGGKGRGVVPRPAARSMEAEKAKDLYEEAGDRANVGRRSVADGCARTPTQLQMDLQGAFALGDVNRVAESYHWVGISSDQARTTMDRLQQLTNHPVLDTRYYNAGIGAGSLLASASGAPGGGGILHLLLAGDGSPSVVDFDVHRYAGCYFVSF